MKTITELDAVTLTCDMSEFGLKAGDVGTAVLVHGEGLAFEVEFASSSPLITSRHRKGMTQPTLKISSGAAGLLFFGRPAKTSSRLAIATLFARLEMLALEFEASRLERQASGPA